MAETPEQLWERAHDALRTPPLETWEQWPFEGEVRPRAQQLSPLPQGRRQGCASLGRDVGVEGVEVQRQRRAVDGERREDVARAGESDEADAVALQVLHQAPRLAQRAPQPARARVLGEHGAGDVHREDEVQAPALRHDGLLPPARAGEGDGAQKRRHRERRRPTPASGAGECRGRLRPQGRAANPHTARPGGAEPHPPAHQRGQRQDERCVERDHGTRTANVAETTISSARPSKPRLRGTR